MIRLGILVCLCFLFACSNDELYDDLGALSGDDIIAIGPENVSGNIGKIFSKYVFVTAPNGGRIEIFGTSGVSDEQMIYAKKILTLFLTSEGEVYKKKHKDIIANSMANKKCALVFFDTEDQYEDNISKVATLGYNVQDLYATESLGSGNRDASYEEILHLVHNYGIAPTLFEYQHKLQKANDNAISKGIWKPRQDGDDLPEADFDDEYLAALMDCYIGLWKDQESTMWGQYTPSSREELMQQDLAGYQLIVDLFGDIEQVR